MLQTLLHDPWVLLVLYAVLGFLASLVVAAIGGGGGLILVSGLGYVFQVLFPSEVALKLAIGTSIALFPAIAISALFALSTSGARWDRRYFAIALPFILIGANIGPRITMALPESLLYPLIGSILFIYGCYQLLTHGRGNQRDSVAVLRPGNVLLVATVGLMASTIAGASGVAIGVFLIPCLARYMPYRQAISTSISAAVPSTIIGALSYALAGHDLHLDDHALLGYVYLPAFFTMLVTVVIGAIVGGKLMAKLPVASIRVAFYVYVIAAGLVLGLR